MTESTLPPEPAKDATADELEADIAATRHQLGETIDALEDKLDVSAQAKRKVDETKTQIADKVNTTKTEVANKVAAVRTQVTDKVAQTTSQVTDKVAQTKAKVTAKKDDGTPKPVTETVYPAEAPVTESGPGSTRLTFPGKASQAAVTNQVKNITTRLANKVTEARTGTKTAGSDAAARRAQIVDGTGPALAGAANSTASTRAQFTSTAAALTGKVGQAKAGLAGKASQFTARTRQNPRGALPAAGAVLAGAAVVGWLSWRAARRPDPVLKLG